MPPNDTNAQPAGGSAGGAPAAGAGAGAGSGSEPERESRSKAWEAAEQFKAERDTAQKKLAAYETKEKEDQEKAAKARGEHEKLADEAKRNAEMANRKYQDQLRKNALLEAAQKHGLRSTRYLSLIDSGKLEIVGDEVRGAEEAVAALKKEDPSLFGTVDTKNNESRTGTDPGSRGSPPLIDPKKAYSPEEVQRMTSKERTEYLRIHGLSKPKIDPMTGLRVP